MNKRLISSNYYRTLSNILTSHADRYICAPTRPTLIDRIWYLLVPVETEVDPHTANKVRSDSTRNEQVKTSVCLIKFDGSSANVTLFSSREILLFLE